jgi:hypothetical protein
MIQGVRVLQYRVRGCLVSALVVRLGLRQGMGVCPVRPGWRRLDQRPGTRRSRQAVLEKVKRGELRAVLTRTGRRKCLCIEIPASQDSLF